MIVEIGRWQGHWNHWLDGGGWCQFYLRGGEKRCGGGNQWLRFTAWLRSL